MLFVFISLPKLPFEDGLEPKGNDDQQEPKPFHRLAAPACLIHEKKSCRKRDKQHQHFAPDFNLLIFPSTKRRKMKFDTARPQLLSNEITLADFFKFFR